MPYDAPSTSTVERVPLNATGAPTVVCLCCGDTMKHFLTIAKLGARPERLVFVCPSCNGVDAKELRALSD